MINIKVSDEMKGKLIKLAEKDKRTLSDFVRLELEKVIDKSKK